MVFRKVPGGTFQMGLPDAELEAVRAIERSGGVEDTVEPFLASAADARPVREVRVEPFLIARYPLTVAQVRHWLPEYEDAYAEADTGTARLEDDLDDLVEVRSRQPGEQLPCPGPFVGAYVVQMLRYRCVQAQAKHFDGLGAPALPSHQIAETAQRDNPGDTAGVGIPGGQGVPECHLRPRHLVPVEQTKRLGQ
ncbi:hypothetical protein [Plantactinospora sp. KLBMP9567]|uniref:hypothetical protein n=1 Tax=Plantactinospora sp. KLBMP9567 TaxID=3085900 RepID=UPI002981313E|nr:hypothetical protein [Plantactinospora sp. KLBMP9567]MDW5324393.1 hypothetical protein [Plantactinospora sp. KLBMP9567]